MPHERDDGEPQVKVTDRRRFTPEGEPLEPAESETETELETEAEADVSAQAPDERDRKIAEQAARIDELSRAYAALLQDNKAFRGRMEREQARIAEAERVRIAQGLLEAADDLERALGAVAGAPGEATGGLAEGVRLSLGTLHQRIARLGAERLAVTGQPFDPRVAEAIDTVVVADAGQDGVVVQEVTPGYRIGERVLRPARVRVGRLPRA